MTVDNLSPEDGHPAVGPSGQQSELWEVFWCYNGWWEVSERLVAYLPSWATFKRLDPSLPLSEQVVNAAVLVPTTGVVDGAVIRAAKKLQLIVQPAAGFNNIDLEAAKECGVPVCNAPGVNATSVAEGCIMTILMLARKVPQQLETFRQQGIGVPLGVQLSGKTLGIVGMGNIGRRVSAAAQSLGMLVVSITSQSCRSELEAMLRNADVISLNCPLNSETHHLLGSKEFGMMKDGVLICNYARGDVIHKQALMEALDAKKVAGVGLDVHWVEPADSTETLYQHPNVIAFPHTGGCTREVFEAYGRLLSENIVRMRQGRELLHRLV